MATLINTITVNSTSALAETTVYTVPTQSVADAAEEFEASVNAADGNWFVEIDNSDGGTDVTVSLLAGDFVGARTVSVGTVKAAAKAVIFADSATCKATGGNIHLELKPASGVSLSTCGIKMHAVQFLPAECK